MLIALLIGMLVGAILGLTGAGGSVFAVPLLMLLMNLSIGEATGVALGAVAISAISAVVSQHRTRQLLWPPAMIFAATGSIIAPLGAMLGARLNEKFVLASFAVLAFGIAVRMFYQAQKQPAQTRVVRANLEMSEAFNPICRITGTQFDFGFRCLSALALAGMVTGLLSGLYGVGGGFIVVPLLIFLAQLTMRQAVGTSLAIISIISTVGFVSYVLRTPQIDLHLLAAVGAGGIGGMMIGHHLSARIAGPVLQKLFAVMLVILTTSVMLMRL